MLTKENFAKISEHRTVEMESQKDSIELIREIDNYAEVFEPAVVAMLHSFWCFDKLPELIKNHIVMLLNFALYQGYKIKETEIDLAINEKVGRK